MHSDEDLKDLYTILDQEHHVLLDAENNPEPHPKISDLYVIEALEDEYEQIYEDFISYLIDGDGDIENIRKKITELNEKLQNV